MKKLERITKNIKADKEISKAIDKESYYEIENFIKDAQEYIKAIKDRRMINNINSVSNSGMSRTIKFLSCEKSKDSFYYRQYSMLFTTLGYSDKNKSGYFRVNGCGMDMIFHTNYSIIHRLQRLGFISKAQCSKLAQMTPTTI